MREEDLDQQTNLVTGCFKLSQNRINSASCFGSSLDFLFLINITDGLITNFVIMRVWVSNTNMHQHRISNGNSNKQD